MELTERVSKLEAEAAAVLRSTKFWLLLTPSASVRSSIQAGIAPKMENEDGGPRCPLVSKRLDVHVEMCYPNNN